MRGNMLHQENFRALRRPVESILNKMRNWKLDESNSNIPRQLNYWPNVTRKSHTRLLRSLLIVVYRCPHLLPPCLSMSLSLLLFFLFFLPLLMENHSHVELIPGIFSWTLQRIYAVTIEVDLWHAL